MNDVRDWLHRHDFARKSTRRPNTEAMNVLFTPISAANLETAERTLLALAKNNPALQVLVRNIVWQANQCHSS